jgi:tRNA-dihydrouridine synthase B
MWDNDPAVLAETGARLVAEVAPSVIDINFGCPVTGITENAKSGSYLLRDPERIGAIVARVVAACHPTPVTAKIRLGCTRAMLSAADVAQAVEGAGGAALTVHGRTAQEMFRGQADWDEIAKLKACLKRIPLIGNGDLRTPAAVVEAFARYGVDGVMIGRAALGQPWLFRQMAAALRGEPAPAAPTLLQQRDILWNHYCQIVARFGPGKGTILMRRYACRYAQGCSGARRFRAQVAQVSTPEEFAALLQSDFPTDEGKEKVSSC